MFSELTHYETLRPLIDRAEEQIAPYVKKAQEVAEYNQFRVLDAFRRHKVDRKSVV